MSILWPTHLHDTQMKPDWLTHDREIVQRHILDKQIRRVISSRLFCLMSREMKASLKTAERLRCPVLIAQAGDDFIVNKDASKAFYDAIRLQDKEFKLYDGFFHEVLNEVRRQEPYQDIGNWLSRHC